MNQVKALTGIVIAALAILTVGPLLAAVAMFQPGYLLLIPAGLLVFGARSLVIAPQVARRKS